MIASVCSKTPIPELLEFLIIFLTICAFYTFEAFFWFGTGNGFWFCFLKKPPEKWKSNPQRSSVADPRFVWAAAEKVQFWAHSSNLQEKMSTSIKKVVVVGPLQSGKSCLSNFLSEYNTKPPSATYMPTVGCRCNPTG
jgi:hypothetical protein